MVLPSPSASSQRWNPDAYGVNADFVPALGQPVLDLLQPQSGERILDLGCGDGVLTQKLVALRAHVVGIDNSPEMIAVARQRGIDASVMDARALVFENEFDAVFSNAVLHWLENDPDAPIAGAFRALKVGGRFVGELGGHACVGAITVALVATLGRRGIRDPASWIPWYFPTVEDYETRACGALGLCRKVYNCCRAPPRCRPECAEWLDTFANPFCAALPCEERGRLSRRRYGAPQASSLRCERALDGGLRPPSLCRDQTLTQTHEFASA